MPQPTYRRVKDVYDKLHDAGVVTETLPEWSATMNERTGTELFSAGLHDNWIKRASVGIDRLLEQTPFPEATQEAGGVVGELLGNRAAGERVGKGIPRSTLNMASFLIPGAGWANVARLGIAGLLTGSETYTETGSPAAGALSGATAVALPGVTGKVEQLAARKLGSRLVEGPLADTSGKVLDQVKQYFPETLRQKVGTFAAGQVGAAALMETSGFGQDIIAGQDLHNPFSVDTLLNLTLGQVPFAAIHGANKVLGRTGPSADTTQHAVDLSRKAIERKVARETTPETFTPEPPTPEVLRETQLRLSQIRGEQVRLDPTNIDEANRLLLEEHNTLRQHTPVSNSVFGDSIVPDAPREQVVGRELKSNSKWRAIEVADIPANPEELRGKVVTYSTAYEPNPTLRSDGGTVFGLPDSQWRTIKTAEEWHGRYKKTSDGQPDLPVQDHPATDEQLFSHIQDLAKVKLEADMAQNPAELQKAVVRLQGVQHENNLPVTNDSTLRPIIRKLDEEGADPKTIVQTAVKVEAKRTERKLRAVERAAPPLTEKEAAHVSAIMGEGGFSVVTADKLSHTKEIAETQSEPLRNIVEEAAYTVTNPHVKAKPEDVQMFRTLVGQLGKLSDVGPSELADVAQYISDRDGTPLPEVKDEVRDFLTRPHVKEWNQQLEQQVEQTRQENLSPGGLKPPPGERLVTVRRADGSTYQASFADKFYEGNRASIAKLTPEGKWSHTILGKDETIVEPLKAGVGWLFSLAPYDPVRGLLGGKHTIPKSGYVKESVLRNIGGSVGKPLTKAEIDLYRVIVPEAFSGEDVSVPILVKGLEEKGPQVEVRKLGDKKVVSEERTAAIRRDQILHALDTQGYSAEATFNDGTRQYTGDWTINKGGSEIAPEKLPESVRALFNELRTHRPPETDRGDYPSDARYSFLGPKPESEMPGYVEGLVKVPVNVESQRFLTPTKNPLYRGPHFGSEDTNVLAFFRGYEETLPDGTKAFHVIEVQSDWGQRQRERESNLKAYESGQGLDFGPDHIPSPQEVKDMQRIVKEGSHPLLKVYESLALKAAIQHAKEVGATKVILSDAETAMMTEGHDRHIPAGHILPTATAEDFKLPQEKGMRLHYDQTLPSAMEKLTGEKGQEVSLGQHKNVVSDLEYQQSVQNQLPLERVGSPVFRDASGAPKTQITGRQYDISHLPTDFTVTEPNRAPTVKPFVPETATDIAKVQEFGLERGGLGLHEYLSKTTNPIVKALYEGIKPYTDVMSRIEVMVGENKSGESAAYDLGNGKTRIVLSPTVLDSPIRDFTIAHELVHGLTISELNNPTKIELVRQFDDMRQRLIEALPKHLQVRLNELVKTDWKSKYGTGENSFESIFDGTSNEKTLLYSLLNTKEMVAQGLSSRQMQTFMRSVKAEKGNWFSRFTNTVKDLLGLKTEGSLFEEFLTKTNQLIEHGDYVASFREFSERYFENLGLSDSLVAGHTRRALGLVIDSGFGTSKEDILSRLGQDVGVQSPEYYAAKKQLNLALDKQSESYTELEQLMGEVGFETSAKGVDDLTQEVLAGNIANHSDVLDMMPKEVSDYVFAKVKDMQDVLGVLKFATNEKNKGLINLADPATLRGPVREALTAIDRVMQVKKVHELGAQLIEEAHAIAPDVFADRAELAPKIKVLDEFGNEDPRKVGHLSYFLTQASRIARRFPVTAELIDRSYELGANAATMKGNILKVLGVDLKNPTQGLTKEGLAASVKAISNPKTLNAVDRWMYWSNEIARREKRGVTMLPDNHSEITKILGPLSAVERSNVIDTVAKRSISNQVGHSETLEKMHQIGATLGAHIVMKDRGMKTQESLQLSDQMFNALRMDRQNPQLAQQADAMVAAVQGKMSPEGFLDLLKYTQAEVQKFNMWSEYFKTNPDWSTARRLERFLVTFTRGTKKKQLQASSVKEANEIAKGGKNVEVVDQWKGTEDDFPVLGPDVEGLFQKLSELEQNQFAALKSRGYLTEEGASVFEKMSVATQLARETAAQQGGVPTFNAPARLLSQGADELPWFWNHVAHSERIANFWSRKLFRAQASLHLADPDMVANPQVQSWMKQHVENMLLPDPAATQKITRFVSTWFMGFNPASAMMNGFQTITTAVPEMTLINGGRGIDSYQKWGRAVAEVSKQSTKGQWSTDDHKWLSKMMSESHEWDFSMYSDEAYTQEAAATDFKRIMMKQKPTTIGQKLGTLSGNYSTVGMFMFKSVERFNNKVASVMAFDHFMGEGMSREEALVETKRFNRSVNYTGGRANRPVGLFANSGSTTRSAAMLASNMQGYNLGVVGQIADYLQRGYFRPEGITPAEVYAARKAATQMLATQMVAAGALGLPFVSGTLALVNTLFPDLEINRHVREWAKDFFDGDKKNGNIYGDIALTGLPSMVGWDMQSRLSMGNIVPGVSEYNGFQPETLLGPPANLVKTFVNGAARVVSGDPKGGEAFLPPAVKKLYQLIRDYPQAKDYKNRPVVGELSVGEQAGMALGFQPKRVSDFNAAARIAEQNKLVAARREGQYNQHLAEEVLRGNFGNVRSQLLERAGKETDYKPVDAVHAIVQHAEDLTFPRDLRREGTARTSQDRNRLLSTFNVAPETPSEVSRLRFRQALEQRLGVPPTRDRRQAAVAQLMDQLKVENPTATRSELRRLAEQRLRVSPRTQSLLQE